MDSYIVVLFRADMLSTIVVAIVCICVYSVYSCRGFWPTVPTVVYPFVVVWVKCRGEYPSLIRARLCL